MASNNQGGNKQSGNSGNRGFASMDPERQREIASEGGRAAHAKGTAHEFTSEEARRAGSMSHGGGNQQSGNQGGNRSGSQSGNQSGNQQSGNQGGNRSGSQSSNQQGGNQRSGNRGNKSGSSSGNR